MKATEGATRTWPADWEARKTGRDCPMCAEGRPDENRFGVRFFEGARADGYLSRVHPQRGYAFVTWRGRHVAEPTALSAEEAAEFWSEVLGVARALEAQFQPAKLNILILGNETPHLHAHVVPRYLDDPSPERPLHEAPDARPPIPEEVLRADAEALRRALR